MPEFNLDPSTANSFQDQLAMLRQSLPPAVTANLPPIPGQPVQQAPPMPAPVPQMSAEEYSSAARPGADYGPGLVAGMMADLKYAQENQVSLLEAKRVRLDAQAQPMSFSPMSMTNSPTSIPQTPASMSQTVASPATMPLSTEAAIAPDQLSMSKAPTGNFPPASEEPQNPLAPTDSLTPTPAAIPHSIGQAGDPTYEAFKAQVAQINPKIWKEMERQLHNIQPPDLVGPDVFKSGRGGILGTGIEPIDVLFMALAMGATWNLPQAQAQANAFEIMGWPSKYKDHQRKASNEFMQVAFHGINSMGAAQTSQQKAQEIVDRNAYIDLLEKDIIKAAESGHPMPEVTKQLRSVQARRFGIDPQTIKHLFASGVTEQLAGLEEIRAKLGPGHNVTGTIQLPGGGHAIVDAKQTQGHDYSQRTREMYNIAQASGKPISWEQANRAAYDQEVGLAGAKAGAVSQNQPLPPTTGAMVTKLTDIKSQMDIAKKYYSPDFVGPAVWRTYDLRRQGLPGLVGDTPPSPEEVKFHEAQKFFEDQRLRIQSGAQTSEPEAWRILGTLPQGTDTPKVYEPGLDKAVKDTDLTLKTTVRVGVTPRKDIEAKTAPPGPPAGAKTRDYRQMQPRQQ